ncbi:uncharacterized protein BYT42DRAFT_579003, partial [Radiomyces spectabilis]|uniref:uncharacterized protein n=1 Tax=Radiomyces spectabilis TaxID=64574 RepID=UPI00221EF628
MLIDTQILYTQILNLNQRSVNGLSNLDLWSRRPFKQTKGKVLSFYGTLQTDGVGVSITKQNTPSRKGGRQKKIEVLEEDVPYVNSLAPTEQRAAVLIDPGQRDLLFCMHEYSEPNARILYRYTSCQKANELKTK